MRLRTILATTMAEGMRRVRDQLGPDAIIVQTQELDGGGVMLTAAADQRTAPAPAAAPAVGLPWNEPPADPVEALHELLAHHRLPPPAIADLLGAAEAAAEDEPRAALHAALAARLAFAPLGDDPAQRPLMLVGPPGAGKTVTLAKLAAESVLAGRRVALVCADTGRAGGLEQLAAFAAALGTDVLRAPGAEDLQGAVHVAGRETLVLIDAPAVDPCAPDDALLLRELAAAARAEPLAVLPAGMDAAEAADLAAAFRDAGAMRFIASRVDASRRIGAVLCAATAGLGLAAFGVSRRIAGGLRPADPGGLADLLLERMPAAGRLPALPRLERAAG